MRKKKVNPALLVAVLVAAVAAAFLIVQPALEAQPAAAPTPTPQVSVSDGDGLTSVQRFIVLPDDGIESLTDLIGSARKRVFMKMYMLTDQRIVDALAQAQKNGADVRVMLEDHPFGAANSGQQAIDLLKAAGITTKVSNPTFRLTHEKSFIIDNVAVILTANMTKSAFSRNREFGVVDAEQGDVDEIVAAFNADWDRAGFVPSRPNLVWSPDNSRERINRVIEKATRTLDVYAEIVVDDQQVDLLAQAAKRGVKVRLITSPSSGEDTSSSAPGLDALQSGGVKVRLVSSPYMHAKAFVSDGALAFVGSENISTASLDFNRELGVVLADRDAIRRISTAFERDWNKGVER